MAVRVEDFRFFVVFAMFSETSERMVYNRRNSVDPQACAAVPEQEVSQVDSLTRIKAGRV